MLTEANATEEIFSTADVAVGFGSFSDVLTNITMTIKSGDFVTLLGPSGCGKTTILNLAAGLLDARRGQVLFEGREITGVNTSVGYMTQDDTLLPWRTVSSNIALPLKIRRWQSSEIYERVSSFLDMLDLTHARNMFPGQLSGGMRRRALLARSMIYEPALLLMDEPFAALDAQMRRQLHGELRSAVKRIGETVLFVTHDLNEAALLSDRVLVVGAGPPGTIIADIPVPFGSERDLEALPFDDAFVEFERELYEKLSMASI